MKRLCVSILNKKNISTPPNMKLKQQKKTEKLDLQSLSNKSIYKTNKWGDRRSLCLVPLFQFMASNR